MASIVNFSFLSMEEFFNCHQESEYKIMSLRGKKCRSGDGENVANNFSLTQL